VLIVVRKELGPSEIETGLVGARMLPEAIGQWRIRGVCQDGCPVLAFSVAGTVTSGHSGYYKAKQYKEVSH
jgi:hypothetical protein